MKNFFGFVFIGTLLIASSAFGAVATDPDITGIGGGVSEGSDVGFGNITATSLSLSGDMSIAGDLAVDDLISTANEITLRLQPGRALTGTDDSVAVYSLTGVNTGETAVTLAVRAYHSDLGASAATDFLIDRIGTSNGTGEQLLIDAQDAGSSQFSITNKGAMTAAGGIAFSGLSTITSDYAIGNFKDDPTWFIECDTTFNNVSVTMPPVADKKGRLMEIKLMSAANDCYVGGNGAETIDWEAGQAITIRGNSISLFAGSTQWLIY